MRIIDDAGARQSLLDGAPYDVTVTVTPVGGTAVIIDADHIAQNGIKINPSSVSGNKLELGTVISATGDFEFFNFDGALDGIDFNGAELYVEGSVDVNGTEKAFPIGYFIAENAKTLVRKITVQCFDRMVLFDKTVAENSLTFPTTPYDLIEQCCLLCGVPMATMTASALPNYDYAISVQPSGEYTYRQFILWAAQIMGRCTIIDNKGELDLVWYASADWESNPDNRFEGGETDKTPVSITGVKVVKSGVNLYVAGQNGYTINIVDNALLFQNDFSAAIDNVWDDIGPITYYPASFDIIHNVIATPFDLVDYTDTDGTVKTVAVTDVVWDFTARTKIQSKGVSEETDGYAEQSAFTPAQSGQIADASRLKIGRIESADGSIYFDLNTGDIFTDGTTERVTSSRTKSVFKTDLDFSNGAFEVIVYKDGTEIGRTEIGVNGVNLVDDESQGVSFPKPENWDNWPATNRAAWWVVQNIIKNRWNLLNTVNNSFTVVNKDQTTTFKQTNVSSNAIQVFLGPVDYSTTQTAQNAALTADGLAVQRITIEPGAADTTVEQSEYKYDAAVQGHLAAKNMKVGSADYNSPDAKPVAAKSDIWPTVQQNINAYVAYSGRINDQSAEWDYFVWQSAIGTQAELYGYYQFTVPANGLTQKDGVYYVSKSVPWPTSIPLIVVSSVSFVNCSIIEDDNANGDTLAWIGHGVSSDATNCHFSVMRMAQLNDAVTFTIGIHAIVY